jgi:transposase
MAINGFGLYSFLGLYETFLRTARLANMPPCLIGMEACVGAHHLSRELKALGHDARLLPAKYVRPYSKGQKNDFRDAEAIAEAVQRPTMFSERRHDPMGR